MRKILPVLACLLLASAAHATKIAKLDIINDKGFKSADYNKLRVFSVSDGEFLKTIKDIKNYDAVSDQVNEVNLAVKLAANEYASTGYSPGKGTKLLTLTLEVSDYNAGSTAAAVFVGGFGGGNGHCKYKAHFWDGQTEVASFETTSRISHSKGGWGGGRRATNGDESRDRIPKEVVNAVEKFLQTH